MPATTRRRSRCSARRMGKAHGIQDDTLVEKIGDLIEWQQALAS